MLCATVAIVAARSRLWGTLPSWLQAVLGKRLVQFALAAIPGLAVGLGLYYIEVSCLDANKLAVRPANWVLTTGIGFVLNWLVFSERKSCKHTSGAKFYLVALACAGCSFSLFAYLTLNLGIQYLLAQVLVALAIGLPHYAVVNWFVFRRNKVVAV